MTGGADFKLSEVEPITISTDYVAAFFEKYAAKEHNRLRGPPPVVAERLTLFAARKLLLI